MKRDWPEDTRKSARQIAGLANAARGEPVLWVVGVDDRTGEVAGAGDADLAAWWSKLSAQFDERPPDLRSLVVPVGDGRTVVALEFATDLPPYVVKTGLSGDVVREVPWRDGTRTRSAYRHELLRPLGEAPQLAAELVSVRASLAADAENRMQDGTVRPAQLNLEWSASAFLGPAPQLTVVPLHTIQAWFALTQIDGAVDWITARRVLVSDSAARRSAAAFRDSNTVTLNAQQFGVEIRQGAIFILGGGLVKINVWAQPLMIGYPVDAGADLVVNLAFGVSGYPRPVQVGATLTPAASNLPTSAVWKLASAQEDGAIDGT